MKVYNKLVRDRIPEIIENSGKKANYRVLDEKEYRQALKDKLLEEVNEFLVAETKEEMIEELVDISDVLFYIKLAIYNDYDHKYFRYIQDKKYAEKGTFHNRYFLESVED